MANVGSVTITIYFGTQFNDLNVPYYVQPVKVNYSDITTQIPVLYMIERIGKKLYNQYSI